MDATRVEIIKDHLEGMDPDDVDAQRQQTADHVHECIMEGRAFVFAAAGETGDFGPHGEVANAGKLAASFEGDVYQLIALAKMLQIELNETRQHLSAVLDDALEAEDIDPMVAITAMQIVSGADLDTLFADFARFVEETE